MEIKKMKKMYFLIGIILLSGLASFGQSIINFPEDKTLEQKENFKFIKHQNPAKDATSRWYNYGDAMDLVWGGEVGEYAANYLFPDSTMQVEYAGGVIAGTWIHKIAEVFDPSSDIFNDPSFYPGELNIEKNSTYTLDSMEIYCFYMRGPSSSTAIDTLLVEIKLGNFPTGTSGFSFFGPTSPVSINLNTDTTKFVSLLYTHATNSFGYVSDYTIKIPLDEAFADDTLLNGLNVVKIAPNLSIGPNQLTYVSVSFIPGYVWSPNVSMMIDYNRFRFLSLNEGGNFPIYTKGDWNVSYILPQDVRYNDAGGWNGRYIPSFAYMGGASMTYSYLHHAIYYKITDPDVSIRENGMNEKLSNAFPNPVHANSHLIIPVKTNDPHATIVISDIFGREVMKFSNINNEQQIIVDTSGLKEGLYLYSLQTGQQKLTKKFTVVR
jgi:hypothetical protein